MNDDTTLNKVFQTFINSETNEHERATAHALLLKLIGKQTVELKLKDASPVAGGVYMSATDMARMAKTNKELAELRERCSGFYNQLKRLSAALHAREAVVNIKASPLNKTDLVKKLKDSGVTGIAKNDYPIHRRQVWRELQKENTAFLVPELGDFVLVHYIFRDAYPDAYAAHEARNRSDIERGNIDDILSHMDNTIIVNHKRDQKEVA